MTLTAPGAAFRRLAPNVQGAIWMLASGLAWTVMASLVKHLGTHYPAPLETFYRQAVGFAVVLPLIIKRRSAAFATTKPWILIFRGLLAVFSINLSIYAYQKIPLADANVLSFTRTLFLTLLAIFVLKEKTGALRIGAVLAGFAGVILMVAPGAGAGPPHLSLGAAAMLGSSFLMAFSITGMKVMTRDHGPTVLLVWSMTLGVLLAIPGAIVTWRWPDPDDVLLLIVMGVAATLAQGLYMRGMAVGDASAMAPMDYTRLIFAAAAGFIFFGDVPGPWTLAGAGVVVAATLIITWREQQLMRARRGAAS